MLDDLARIDHHTACSLDPLTSKELLVTRYRLTRYELELLNILWQIGEGTVQDVSNRLTRDLAYTTVMTTLNLLAIRKKVLVREKRGRAFVYRPIVTREEISKTVLAELTDVLFGNRLPELVLNLWTERQSDERAEIILRDAIERVRAIGQTSELVTTMPVSAPLIETQT